MQQNGRIQRLVESRKNNGVLTRSKKKTGETGRGNASRSQPQIQSQAEELSSDQEYEVILELIDLNNRFPSHPIHVGRLLKEAGITNFKDIKKIGLFRFKVTTKSNKVEGQIRNTKMDHQNLKVYEPWRKSQTICFIRGVPLNFEDHEILDNLESEYEGLQAERVKKRGRNNQLQDTANIKLTVKGPSIPGEVKIYGCSFKPELYIFPVRQCNQCWKFGHGVRHCRSRPRCRKCGGRHQEAECGQTENCINCGRDHDAQSEECPERARRWNILNQMRKGATYQEAESNYPKLTNRFDVLSEEAHQEEAATGPPEATRSGNRISNKEGRKRATKAVVHAPDEEEEARTSSQTQREIPTSQLADTGVEGTGSKCQCRCNPYSTTEFERFVDKLRKDFLAEARAEKWIDPLKAIYARIVVGVNEANNAIETDKLLIETAQAIQGLITKNVNLDQQECTEPSTDYHSHSVV